MEGGTGRREMSWLLCSQTTLDVFPPEAGPLWLDGLSQLWGHSVLLSGGVLGGARGHCVLSDVSLCLCVVVVCRVDHQDQLC